MNKPFWISPHEVLQSSLHCKYSLSFINLIDWNKEAGDLITFFLGIRGVIRKGSLFEKRGTRWRIYGRFVFVSAGMVT